MRALGSRDLLELWDRGDGRQTVDRALGILNEVMPERSRSELAGLTLGQRDALLLEVREALFGSTMAVFVECPRCHERLEFSVSAPGMRAASFPGGSGQTAVRIGDFVIQYRVPNSEDMMVAMVASDVESVRRQLLQRCVLQAQRGSDVIPMEALPAAVVEAVVEQMERQDPLADIRLEVVCPDCGNAWLAAFDIAAFLWAEISVHARHLLHEVHELARMYGWRESDLLAMSSQRRRMYLQMEN